MCTNTRSITFVNTITNYHKSLRQILSDFAYCVVIIVIISKYSTIVLSLYIDIIITYNKT